MIYKTLPFVRGDKVQIKNNLKQECHIKAQKGYALIETCGENDTYGLYSLNKKEFIYWYDGNELKLISNRTVYNLNILEKARILCEKSEYE